MNVVTLKGMVVGSLKNHKNGAQSFDLKVEHKTFKILNLEDFDVVLGETITVIEGRLTHNKRGQVFVEARHIKRGVQFRSYRTVQRTMEYLKAMSSSPRVYYGDELPDGSINYVGEINPHGFDGGA